MGRVVSNEAFVRAARKMQRQGGRVVFTNGIFDLLHYGHVAYLQKARRLGDMLVVAVNTDKSTRRLKGSSRPLIHVWDRVRVLAALECVDLVTAFDTDTPEWLIERVRPDVLVKGADYKVAEIAGGAGVKSRGGRVVRIPLSKGRSTSQIVEKIRKS